MFGIFVERTDDQCDHNADEADDGQPPDVPDQPKPDQEGEASNDHAQAGILRHVDWQVVRLGRFGIRIGSCQGLFLDPEGVALANSWDNGEVILRRR